MVMKANVEGRTDFVVAEDLSQEEWLDLRREQHAVSRRTRATLCSCVDCGHPVHPKENRLHTRFFAHNPDAPDTCPLKTCDGESPEHKRLKLGIYRAIKKTAGWDADIEAVAPEADVATGKPIKVDVTATRQKLAPAVSAPKLQGWEVQLSGLDDGHALDRQEARNLWLERCTWVTRHRPSWAELLPWYQVAPKTEEHPDLVVDGVVRWEEHEDKSRGGRYVNESPFKAELMVRNQLRGALWVQDIGWILQGTARAKKGPRILRTETVKSVVAEYCERTRSLDEETRTWTDDDWMLWSGVAHDRQRRGFPMTDLDREALIRWPELSVEEIAKFPRHEGLCVLCQLPTIVSASDEMTVHHRCAWGASR